LKLRSIVIINQMYIKRMLLILQADPNADVRGRMINAGILIIDKHGRENVSLLFPIFENYLNKTVSS
jgi:hypothetical protein